MCHAIHVFISVGIIIIIYVYQLGTGRCTQKVEPVDIDHARYDKGDILALHNLYMPMSCFPTLPILLVKFTFRKNSHVHGAVCSDCKKEAIFLIWRSLEWMETTEL